MSRTLVSARCSAKGHLLAQVVARPDGRRWLQVPRPVVAIPGRTGEVHRDSSRRDQELPFPTPDVDWMTYGATCGCGIEYEIAEGDLSSAIAAGVSVLTPKKAAR